MGALYIQTLQEMQSLHHHRCRRRWRYCLWSLNFMSMHISYFLQKNTCGVWGSHGKSAWRTDGQIRRCSDMWVAGAVEGDARLTIASATILDTQHQKQSGRNGVAVVIDECGNSMSLQADRFVLLWDNHALRTRLHGATTDRSGYRECGRWFARLWGSLGGFLTF